MIRSTPKKRRSGKRCRTGPAVPSGLRLDRVLNKWADHWQVLAAKGYRIQEELTPETLSEVRRFLADWYARMRPVYMACSLPDTFQYPEDSARGRLLKEAVIPSCREIDIPLSLMIGVRYQVNPAIRLAGDAVGKADFARSSTCASIFPENRFLTSVLSRENQHELCVYTRKFSNLMPFGCWWFLNNPSIVEEITRERIEMVGTTVHPATFRRASFGAGHLQMEEHEPHNGPYSGQHLSLLARRRAAGDAGGYQTGHQRLFRANFERLVNLRGTHERKSAA